MQKLTENLSTPRHTQVIELTFRVLGTEMRWTSEKSTSLNRPPQACIGVSVLIGMPQTFSDNQNAGETTSLEPVASSMYVYQKSGTSTYHRRSSVGLKHDAVNTAHLPVPRTNSASVVGGSGRGRILAGDHAGCSPGIPPGPGVVHEVAAAGTMMLDDPGDWTGLDVAVQAGQCPHESRAQ